MIRRPHANARSSAWLAASAAVLWALGPKGATPAQAEPAFAVRTGYSCGQCHVNRTGGGMRTPFGSLYSQTTLPTHLLIWRDQGYLLPADPQARFALGGDVRAGLYAVGSDDYEDTVSFEMPAANFYGQLRIIPERLSVYLDQRLGSGASSTRELFALFAFHAHAGYVKFGRFLLPYGWALPDDGAFIREPLGFAFSSSDIGVEVGFEPANWSTHVALTNGNAGPRDADRGKRVSFLTTRRFHRSRLGLSAAYDVAAGTTTTWAGLLGGLNLGRFSLLAEADARLARPDGMTTTETWAGYFEVDFLIQRGMSLKYAHDWADPSRDARTDQQQRDSLGFEYSPYPFVQLRAFVRSGDGPPQVPGARDRQAELELHLYF